MTDAIFIRYSGPAGSFVLAGDESENCRLLRSPDAATNFTWESKTFTELLHFDTPAAFWAWFSRDPDWFLARPLHLDPLMHWEGAIRRVIPDFEPQQFCSVCHRPVAYFPRYSKSLCAACKAQEARFGGIVIQKIDNP